jgi:PKD repeat protein
MKSLSLTLVASLLCVISYAQQKDESTKVSAVHLLEYGVTGRLDEYRAPAGTINEVVKAEKLGYHPKDDWVVNENPNPADKLDSPDAAHQLDYPAPAAPGKALTSNWDGIGYTGVNPADPSVDVGPNHVVQMINGASGSRIQVYNKTGTTIGAEVYFDNFMGMAGGAGDPIVMYDERADRWFLSEFSSTGNNLHIAISQTADPGGTYYTYVYNSPGGFPDYPKYSIWENEYVMTANVNTPDIFAFNRTDLLAGTGTAAQMFSQNNYGTIGFQASTPVSMNGTTVPPAGQPALLMRMRDNSWAGAATDALEMWELTIDWVTPANSGLAQVQTLGITPHESELCGYTSFQCFPQPGTGTTLDPLRELLMNRIHYRNFGTHESIVCCHVTDVDGSDRGGIRWYELRRTGGTAGTWSIYQESTYSPDTDNRWMGSIGISESGNIGLAYSVSSSTTFPSLRYTGRRECDPLNTMTEPETVIAAGTASNASNRWGDYFQMGCDPSNGETFYFTGVYNTSTQWSTRIAAFDIAVCVSTPQVSFDSPVAVTVDESATTVPNGCLNYQDVNVPISIGITPSANADIVIVVTGGTATSGEDFDLLGATFTLAGATLTGTAQLRIYNDDYVEGTETVILGYTLNANGGNAVAGAVNQTYTLTITDDDLDPTSMLNTVIFQDDFQDGTMAPFTTVNAAGGANDPWQVGNNAAASSAAYAIPASNIGQFAWINDDACNCDQNDVDLNFPSVDLSGVLTATLAFDTYFEDNTYAGDNENADLYVSVGGGADVLIGPLTASVIDGAWITQNFDVSAYAGNANVVFRVKYSDATGWLYGCTIDNVLITGTQPIGIQTPVNTGTADVANLGPNGTVHFYDQATGDVMLTVENTSAFDYGCVIVEVDRAGTTPSSVQFNTATAADYLHSKTFTIVPTNTNPSGTYNVTVYYEEAEVAAWETATGNSRNNAEIVKVDGANQISDVTPGTAGSYTISSAASTLGAFYSDVTFTSSFTTGFSGFGVGIYNAAAGIPPVANFSGTPTTICAGASVAFTDLSTNGPTGWDWSFGDGTPNSSLQNPSHVYATAGTFTVTLTATNGSGSDPFTINNYITVNASPTVSASAGVTICDGASTTISGSGATSYTWDNGLPAGASNSVSPSTTTTYTVTGTTLGCSNSDAVTVTVTPLPTVVASGGTSICAGSSTTISASGASTYTWDNGLPAGASNAVSPTVTTTYNVTGTTSGCSNTAAVTINVNALPSISAGTVIDPTTCATATGSIVVNGSGTGDVSWTGTASGSAIGVSMPYTINGLAAGSYNITFVDGFGCTSNILVQGLVDPSAPTITATGSATICAGASVTITGAGGTTYSWDNGLGAGASQNVSPTATTTYNVTGTTSGCSGVASVTITVNANPIISVSSANNPTTCATATGSIVIGGSGTGNVSWTGTASGSAIGVAMPFTITGLAAGSYNISYVDGNGCSSNAIVQALSDPSAPTITATGSATICVGESTTISASGGTTYSWDNGLGAGASQTVSPTTTTTYIVTGTTGACSATDQVTVVVNEVSSSTQNLDICEGASVTVGTNQYSTSGTYTDVLTNSVGCDSTVTTVLVVNVNPVVTVTPTTIDTMCLSSTTPLTLLGTPSGGVFSGTGIVGNTFNASTAGLGSHTITFTYTDGNGCVGTTTLIAVVIECVNSIDEIGLAGVSLFPNPNEGVFIISGLTVGTEYSVFDDRGRLVAQGVTESETQEVRLPSAETGIYYLHSTANGEKGSVKFLITN